MNSNIVKVIYGRYLRRKLLKSAQVTWCLYQLMMMSSDNPVDSCSRFDDG